MNCFVAKHLPSLKVIFFKCLKRSIFPFVCPNSGETLSAPSIYIIILCNLLSPSNATHRQQKRNRAFAQFLFFCCTAYASVFGPAATSALPASLPSYFAKFLIKRSARSLALLVHSSPSA